MLSDLEVQNIFYPPPGGALLLFATESMPLRNSKKKREKSNRKMMIVCVCVRISYLIDEPLFIAICLLSYSNNSSSRAAAFSETCTSIQS